MTGFFPLLRLQLLSRFADFKPRNIKTALAEKRSRTIFRGIGILVLIGYLGTMLYIVEKKMLDVLEASGMAFLLISLAVMMATVGTLILAFFFIMSALYLGRDNPFIAALPIKTRVVLSARLFQVWLSETLINAVILLPACILYGIRMRADAGFCLRMAAVWLLAAVLPICIVTFVSALLIRISALWKRREMIMTVGGILLFTAYMYLMMNLGQFTGDTAEGGEMVERLILNNSAMIRRTVSLFPPAAWAVEGILGNWGQLGLYALVSCGAAVLTIWLMGYDYRRLSLLQSETPEISAKGGIRKGAFRKGSALQACVKREFLQIIRVPSYAVNILPIAFMPLLMVILMGTVIGRNIGANGEGIQAVFRQLNPAIVMAILAAVMAYMSGMNPALATAVSREGRSHGFLTGLPVSPRTLIRAKFLVGFTLALVGIVVASAALVVMFPSSLLPVGLALVLCVLYSYMSACLALARDVKKPKLDWVTEQEAVKQNFGMAISMFVSWGILGVLAVGTWFMLTAEWNIWAVFGVLAGVLLILCALSRKRLMHHVDRYYCQG